MKKIVHPKNLRGNAVEYGKRCEKLIPAMYTESTKKKVSKCGLFIDTKSAFLGASQDALIDDDDILEIKCPYNARNLTSESAIAKNISNLRQSSTKI